jgi:hypothetical protein
MLTEAEVAEIREGVKQGLRGPVLLKWVEQLLADHDARVRLERERLNVESGEARCTVRSTRPTG